MVDKAIGIPLNDFLDRFWPIPPGHAPFIPAKNPFRKVADRVHKGATEEIIAKTFVKIVNDRTLTPGLVARMCAHKTNGDGTLLRVDGAFYRTNNPDAPVPLNGAPQLEDQVVTIEFKRGGTSNDPFSDDGDACPESTSRKEARGQIVTYAEQAFAVQRRIAWFLLHINGRQCRVTRWDRSGVVYTHLFDYCKNWRLFSEVLWRMSQCSDELLGLDPTARRIYQSDPLYKTMDDAAMGRDTDLDQDVTGTFIQLDKIPANRPVVYKYVRALFETSLTHNAPRYLLDVPDGDKIRQYLVGRPIFIAKGALGRGTLGFAALDRETEEFAWLKDCWRVDYTGVEPEGEILRELNAAGVPNIPTVLCYGDLPGQKTVSPEVWSWALKRVSNDGNSKVNLAIQTPGQLRLGSQASTVGNTASPSPLAPTFNRDCQLRLHQHARMVVEEIALPLKHFKKGKGLLDIIYDCLEAHSAAVDKPTSRLHRDISGSNIMMVPKLIRKGNRGWIMFRGLLCDWELSKRIDSQIRVPRQPGTWQFMSATLLNHHEKAAEICDDLEAFFHVLLYYAVRYLKSNLTQKEVGDFIDEYFDQFLYYKQWRCGYRKQEVLKYGLLQTGEAADIEFGSPLDDLFATLLPWFQGNYFVQEYKAFLEQASSPTSPTPASTLPPAKPDEGSEGTALFDEEQSLRYGTSKKRRRADSAGIDNSATNIPSSGVASKMVKTRPRRARAPTAEESENAAKVQTHEAFMTILQEICGTADAKYWPDDRDPSGDCYPKDKAHRGTDYVRLDRASAPFSYIGVLVKQKTQRRSSKRARTDQTASSLGAGGTGGDDSEVDKQS
ncbi:hypothetical protein C8Q73DRAFT_444295 [Cubamyces lactineus]|nr:hypothetical protein C8Q73DRAFT_444295 [Cubamyces lactineus]